MDVNIDALITVHTDRGLCVVVKASSSATLVVTYV